MAEQRPGKHVVASEELEKTTPQVQLQIEKDSKGAFSLAQLKPFVGDKRLVIQTYPLQMQGPHLDLPRARKRAGKYKKAEDTAYNIDVGCSLVWGATSEFAKQYPDYEAKQRKQTEDLLALKDWLVKQAFFLVPELEMFYNKKNCKTANDVELTEKMKAIVNFWHSDARDGFEDIGKTLRVNTNAMFFPKQKRTADTRFPTWGETEHLSDSDFYKRAKEFGYVDRSLIYQHADGLVITDFVANGYEEGVRYKKGDIYYTPINYNDMIVVFLSPKVSVLRKGGKIEIWIGLELVEKVILVDQSHEKLVRDEVQAIQSFVLKRPASDDDDGKPSKHATCEMCGFRPGTKTTPCGHKTTCAPCWASLIESSGSCVECGTTLE